MVHKYSSDFPAFKVAGHPLGEPCKLGSGAQQEFLVPPIEGNKNSPFVVYKRYNGFVLEDNAYSKILDAWWCIAHLCGSWNGS